MCVVLKRHKRRNDTYLLDGTFVTEEGRGGGLHYNDGAAELFFIYYFSFFPHVFTTDSSCIRAVAGLC